MSKLHRYALLLLFSFIASSQTAAPKDKVQWSPLLKLENRKEIDQRLSQPFGDVFQGTVGGNSATISNCTEFLKISGKGFHAADNMQATVLHNDGVDCVALNMLRTAKAPRRHLLPGFEINSDSLRVLPPELSPGVSWEMIAKAKAAGEAGSSWKTYVPDANAVAIGENQISVSQADWKTQVTLYARGDFSGRGNEEVLVRCDYAATKGTFRNSQLFLLAHGSNGAERLRLVRMISVP